MRLLHLTATGPDVDPSTLEFAPRLTVIYGASETGKSYVIEALDYMLGGKKLRDIPPAAPYKMLLLGLELHDGTVITLARDLRRGTRVFVFEEDLRIHPEGTPDRSLLWQHKKGNTETLSHYLLSELGVAGSQLRKNLNNELVSLSMRHMVHLCLIDEIRIQTKFSPLHSASYGGRTAESSAFKLIIQGEDDSAIVTGEDPQKFRQINRGQIAVLDRALDSVRDQLSEVPERNHLTDQLARINASIDSASSAVMTLVEDRDARIKDRQNLQHEREKRFSALVELETVGARFALLERQYATDLRRLAMIEEGGTLLGYFDLGECPYCGAQPENQSEDHLEHGSTAIAQSVRAEAAKTETLKRDLEQTLEGIQRESRERRIDIAETDNEVDAMSVCIASLEADMQPARDDLALHLTKRSAIERTLGFWDHVAALESLKGVVSRESPEAAAGPVSEIPQSVLSDLSDEIRRILTAWQVPGASESRFEMGRQPDVFVQDRPRTDWGKGMRSILHAGFSVGLSEFCTERSLPHPGFVVLDTPVLTYRDSEGASDNEEFLSESVADAFYSYLSQNHTGQVVVLENQTPPKVSAEGCAVVYFSGSAGTGRSGFFRE